MAIIDSHAHLPLTNEGLQQLLLSMKANNISESFVIPGGIVTPLKLSKCLNESSYLETVCDNEEFLNITHAHKNLKPFFFAHPKHDLQKYKKIGDRFFGLKLAPSLSGVSFLDSDCLELIRVAGEFNHLVYAHCLLKAGNKVSDYVTLAKEFPHITFILGHAGVGQVDFQAVEKIKDSHNILFETSGGFSATCAYACKRLGSKRVLFGSEYPLQNPEVEILKLRLLDISPSELNDITFENALHLIQNDRKER